MTSLPSALAVAMSALLLAGCSSVERSAAPIDSSPTASESSVATPSGAPSVEVSSASASAFAETSSSSPTAEALLSEAAVTGASKSTRICVVNQDTIGNRLNRVIWYRYDTNTGMKMPLNESVCAEGGFSSQPDVEGTITISDGTSMVNDTIDIKMTAFNPFVTEPWVYLTGPGLDTGTTRLSEGERFLVSAQASGRQRRLLVIERLPDTQWKEFRITISTPRVCEPGGPCAIGDSGPGGGIVFYDAGSTASWGRYLEVAPQGWSGKPDDPRVKFCATDQEGYGKQLSTERAVGTGRENTIIAARNCGGGATAPSLAANYTGGGKKDWFVPSIFELWGLADTVTRKESGLFSGFDTDSYTGYYWSSSNAKDTNIGVLIRNLQWDTADSEGVNGPMRKDLEVRVRPIRAF